MRHDRPLLAVFSETHSMHSQIPPSPTPAPACRSELQYLMRTSFNSWIWHRRHLYISPSRKPRVCASYSRWIASKSRNKRIPLSLAWFILRKTLPPRSSRNRVVSHEITHVTATTKFTREMLATADTTLSSGIGLNATISGKPQELPLNESSRSLELRVRRRCCVSYRILRPRPSLENISLSWSFSFLSLFLLLFLFSPLLLRLTLFYCYVLDLTLYYYY